MAKDKSLDDTISEEEYTKQMSKVSTLPEDDSPGDSESDAKHEFMMGVEFEPDQVSDPEQKINREQISEPEEEVEVIEDKYPQENIKQIAESARIVSSEQPSPKMDRDSRTNTH